MTEPRKTYPLIVEVDRNVFIAIARLEYRAGTARSTLPEVRNFFVMIGVTFVLSVSSASSVVKNYSAENRCRGLVASHPPIAARKTAP